jgi:MSHA biogenesis protein MshP
MSSVRRMRGFAIVSAIFILVVLAALGAFIVSISTSQQVGSALDVQGVRAYQAARAGIEWGLYRVQSSNGFDYTNPNTRTRPAATTSFAPSAATLASFTVTVVCNASTPSVAGEPIVYYVQSTACSEPNAAEPRCPNTTSPSSLYVERRLEVAF